ncbi:MAG: nucleotidyl transferase AbiEii/AbiGii toxin family protein [Candidatus Omnitrophota bacterium]
MKDYLAERVRECSTPIQARNVMREYLQARILGCLQRVGAMIPLAFHGGTSLRFLYSMPRYSEDLNFTLEGAKDIYNFQHYLKAIRSELSTEGYFMELKINDRKTVHNAFVRFPGLLYELKLSPHRDEVVSVKIEVDTNPPAGAVLATTVVRRYVTLQLQHHDRASLLAGKIHAILTRRYTKGRDIHDLFWYLADANWPAPNCVQLNNALCQTGWKGQDLTPDNWRAVLQRKLEGLSWERIMDDIRPFLESTSDIHLITKENMMRML